MPENSPLNQVSEKRYPQRPMVEYPTPSRLIRKTQRAPQSCSACTRRKVRCSKTIPCIPCLERGQGTSCSREAVTVKGRVVNILTPRPPDIDELQLEIIQLKKRIEELEQKAAPSIEDNNSILALADPEPTEEMGERLHLLIKGLDFMSMGFSTMPIAYPRPVFPSTASPSGQTSNKESSARQAAWGLLPSRVITDTVLAWAHKWTWWHHCVYHVPYFSCQVEYMWETDGHEMEWDWMGLLLSILAVGLFYMDDEEAMSIGFTEAQVETLPDIWCRAAVHCLFKSDLLSVPSLRSVQTIVIICGIANALGHSTLHSTLLAVGVRLAQCLNLHRLGQEPACKAHNEGTTCPIHGVDAKHVVSDWGFIVRENGRRAWLSLLITERLSLSARELNGLPQPGDSMALNITDVEMDHVAIILPMEEPTMVSHHLAMVECADVVNVYLNDNGSRSAALAKVEASLLNMLEPKALQRSEPDYLTWSRHIWLIGIQHKRLVFHRPYFARSFREPKFLPSRYLCISAAQAILQERRKVYPSTFEKIWAVMFHTLAAAVVLTIDFFHATATDIDLELRRGEILELVNALNRGAQQNAYVKRATNVLLSLLAEEDKFRAACAQAPVLKQLRSTETYDFSAMKTSDMDPMPPLSDDSSSQSGHANQFLGDLDVWKWFDIDAMDYGGMISGNSPPDMVLYESNTLPVPSFESDTHWEAVFGSRGSGTLRG